MRDFTQEKIIKSLAEKFAARYTVAGKVFLDTETQEYCLIEFLENSDRCLNYDRTLESDISLANLQNCSNVAVLTSFKLGYVACRQMAQYAETLLKLGGVAVIVDPAEKVVTKTEWLAKCNSKDIFDIYLLYVTLVEGASCYYSCGMNNFGKSDVSLDLSEDIGLANYVMNVFNYYRLTDYVIIQEQQTFQPDLECPKYQITWLEDRQEIMLGRWHLSRINSDLDLEISYEIS